MNSDIVQQVYVNIRCPKLTWVTKCEIYSCGCTVWMATYAWAWLYIAMYVYGYVCVWLCMYGNVRLCMAMYGLCIYGYICFIVNAQRVVSWVPQTTLQSLLNYCGSRSLLPNLTYFWGIHKWSPGSIAPMPLGCSNSLIVLFKCMIYSDINSTIPTEHWIYRG